MTYANKVSKNKEHLDILDAELIAEHHRLTLGICVHSPLGLQPSSVSEYLSKASPDIADLKCPGDDMPFQPDAEYVSFLVSTNALFAINGAKNHWIPAWSVDRLPDDERTQVTILEDRHVRSRLREKRIALAHMEADDEPSDPLQKTIIANEIYNLKDDITKFLV